MANSYNVNKLPAYVEEHKTDLISKAVIGFETAKYIKNILPDVKGDTALNLIQTDVQFGDGSTCGWNEAGTTSLSQRNIEPKVLKLNMSICDKSLLNKYAGHLVKIAANKTDRDLPFEQQFVDDVIANLNAKLEKMIWTGDSGEGNEFDGIRYWLDTTGGIPNSQTYQPFSDYSAFTAVNTVVRYLPAAVREKDDVVVFCGMDFYHYYMQGVVEKNFFHYNPERGANEFRHPGTNIRVIAVPGLNGSKAIYCLSLSNIYLGVDLLNGQEIFDLWYSKDNREFRLAIEFAMGVQIAYPDECSSIMLKPEAKWTK